MTSKPGGGVFLAIGAALLAFLCCGAPIVFAIFSKELKLSILRGLDAGVSLVQIAREHEIHPETIRQWKKLGHKGECGFRSELP